MRPCKVFVSLAIFASIVSAQQTAPPTTGPRTAPPTTGPQTTPPTQRTAPAQTGFNFPTPLFQQPNVGSTLNLTPAQTRQLSEMNTKMQADWRDRFNTAFGSTAQNRDATMNQLQTQFNQAWMQGAGNIFNEAQRSRLNQLSLQSQGPSAFTNPDVQKQLNLTAQQQNQLQQLNTQFNRQLQDFSTVDPLRRDEATRRWNTFQQSMSERVNSILTDPQRKTWSQMTGDAFQFAPPFSGTSTTPTRP
jgi:predicted transglutaminase-like cysteine proteinase